MPGTANLEFRLYDAATAGNQVGLTVTRSSVPLTDGLFTVSLDFGQSAFNGNARWLEIKVSSTTLTPRQPISPTPYALYAVTAGSVPGGVTGSGTAGTLAKFTGTNAIGDSVVTESSGKIGVGLADSNRRLYVRDDAAGLTYPSRSRTSTIASREMPLASCSLPADRGRMTAARARWLMRSRVRGTAASSTSSRMPAPITRTPH